MFRSRWLYGLILILTTACGPYDLTVGVDEDLDGSIDSLTTYTFDGDNRTRDALDHDSDGVVDIDILRTFDDNDNLTGMEIHRGDADPEVWAWRYEADGSNPLQRTKDLDGDGEADTVEVYTYDGDLLTAMVEETTSGETSRVDITYSRGLPFRVSYHDNSGEERNVSIYDWSEFDELLACRLDANADGIPNSITHQSYVDGKIDLALVDIDGSGMYDLQLYYSWGKDGPLTFRRMDAISNLQRSLTYVYSRGELERIDSDFDGDGQFDGATYYSKRRHGDAVKVLKSFSCDANIPNAFTGVY